MNAIQQKGRVRVYAAGGCGMNIGSQLEKHRNLNEIAFANLDIVYIDTSKSNLQRHENIDPATCYLLKNMDGSGQHRAENVDDIDQNVPAILEQFPPVDFNIVLSSGGGGSGSVIAPLLMAGLLNMEAQAIAIVIGSDATANFAKNSLNTLHSYHRVAEEHGALALTYTQNGTDVSEKEADAVAISTIMGLCVLYSRENHRMDSMDLVSWLNYDKVTSYQPQLATLTVVGKNDSFDGLGNIISVATIAKDDDNTALPVPTEYQCTGFVPATADEIVLNRTPMHFVLSDGILDEAATKLQAAVTKYAAAAQARNTSKGKSVLGKPIAGTTRSKIIV